MLGGDLRYRLDRNGPIDENCVRFYAAELSVALEYLHAHRIVHRYDPCAFFLPFLDLSEKCFAETSNQTTYCWTSTATFT